nr:hypothetical protein Hi04_10k_c446_00019 [uncultured bacterium]
MRSPDCIRAGLVAILAACSQTAAAQQAPPAAAVQDATYTVFVRAVNVGSEQITATTSASGLTIRSSGRMSAPVGVVLRLLELKYDPQWKPIEMTLNASVRGQEQTFHTAQRGGIWTTEMSIGGRMSTVTADVNVDLFLPNPFFAPFAALAPRLLTAANGSVLAALIPPDIPVTVQVGETAIERIETPKETIDTKRTRVTVTPALLGAAPIDADVWSDPAGHLLRVSVPAQALEVLREDLSSVATRQVTISRPNDEQVRISSIGFTLAGTISKPSGPSSGRVPAAVLVGGDGQTDRDEIVAGVPVLGQLANALADAGFVTLRYDKRGVGQSGGRAESAALSDYADDLRAAVRLLSERPDVDPKRIAVIGHGQGGAVALLAAAKDKRIAGVALVAAHGIRGADFILEQQRRALDRSSLSDADKEARIDLQKRINDAVIAGKGWDRLPAQVRRQVDTVEFQSILTNDPAKVMPDVRQPVLILHGDLDAEVPPVNADRLEQLARARKNAPAQVVKLRGINHLLIPATTGEVEEYGALRDKHITPDASSAIASWLQALTVK